MKIRYIIVVLLMAVPLFMLAMLPATTVFSLAGDGIKTQGLGGTIWHGSSNSMLVNNVKLDKVSWKVLPQKLVTGDVAYAVNAAKNESELSGVVSKSFATNRVTDVKMKLFLADLLKLIAEYQGTFIPLPITSGVVNGDIKEVNVNNNRQLQSIDGEVVVSDLAFAVQKINGSYFAKAHNQNNENLIELANSADADVLLSGLIKLTPDGGYDANIKLSSHDNTPGSVMTMLSMIGITNKNRQKVFKFVGKLY